MKINRNLSGDGGYIYFRNKYKGKYGRKDIAHRADHIKIVSAFYRKLAEKIAESSEGVHIEGLGYFGILNTGNKVNMQYQKHVEFTWETKGYAFSIAFVPEYSKSLLFKSFSFDFYFSNHLKRKVREQLESGFRYKFNPILMSKNEK